MSIAYRDKRQRNEHHGDNRQDLHGAVELVGRQRQIPVCEIADHVTVPVRKALRSLHLLKWIDRLMHELRAEEHGVARGELWREVLYMETRVPFHEL